ncbi:MAG: metallophosphoesterase family protein [Planctomycetota bacterium]|jgi:phosphodiesterase/alkaline phosphatase D-like protein
MSLFKTTLLGLLLLVVILPSVNGKDVLSIPEIPRDKVICFVLYTVHNNTLKLSAQLYPLEDNENRTVRLQIKQAGKWEQIAQTEVIENGWLALFRVDNWNSSQDTEYRVAHGDKALYSGMIPKNPINKETIVVAAFTGNSIFPRHGGDIPRADIVENIKKLKPDLLFFSGDQVYNHHRHYEYWLRFGKDFGEITRNIPTVTIPDDHDVGQSNLWGASGKLSKTRQGDDGGYAAPVEYVKMVERAQTSHLPDPYDPTPIERGIGVYYTSLTIGRISFAIIEDRKFKSAPVGPIPPSGSRPDFVTTADYDPKSLDVPGAVLLGKRQLKFLRDWAADWHNSDMKCVLSQTIFCGGAHLHGKRDNRVYADLDSNGWPQRGRNKALAEIRKAFAFMIGGDQHLATLIHHGIDEWNDAGYSFCVPSIANLWLRWWAPLEPGKNRTPGMPEYTGEFLDGFANKITMLAVANPEPKENHDALTTRAAGFGVVKFNKKTMEITVECWPRNVDITAVEAKQYAGWPRTIKREDNYARAALAYLPTIEVVGMDNPVIQVVDESNNEIVYTIRIKSKSYRPKVFKKGKYTIKVGQQGTDKLKVLTGISSVDPAITKTINVTF